MRALLCGILLLRLPLFVPLTVLGLREPKQVGALPGPGKADSQLAAFLFFFTFWNSIGLQLISCNVRDGSSPNIWLFFSFSLD